MAPRPDVSDPARVTGLQEPDSWMFDAFRVEPREARLWRGDVVLPLHAKAFAVLCYLVTNAGQLLTKDALLEAVWPEHVASEAVLQVAIREVRRALGDQARIPRFIETVHGRGYRFLAPVQALAASGSLVGTGPPYQFPSVLARRPRHFVGRDAELTQLTQWWTTARQGTRQVGIIVGEPGIGKTALVDTFIAQVTAREVLWVGHGQCIDQYGSGEAYLPVLEALGRLGHCPTAWRLSCTVTPMEILSFCGQSSRNYLPDIFWRRGTGDGTYRVHGRRSLASYRRASADSLSSRLSNVPPTSRPSSTRPVSRAARLPQLPSRPGWHHRKRLWTGNVRRGRGTGGSSTPRG